jgi:FtsP/CotA-like multicopper oxidase with cupredoxin domain
VIPATPVNYEQNTRSITIGSVAMHGLWLGPAERADVIVDFSKFAGKTLILYNDAPAPAPAVDSRLDYFTGDGDQGPIGGAPNTLPGYGPNTRTIMQVVVGSTPTPTAKPLNLPGLKAAFATTAARPGVFAATQPTIVVPEPGYNTTYNKSFPSTYMGIHDNNMTFSPIAPLTFESLLTPEPSTCTTNPVAPVQCGSYNQKAIQELFTLDYGRMNATLGTELPLTNFQNQTTIPLGYVDPATEIVRQGDTQLWKITHNGVDTHFIHFHLFNVQVVNRVGWDGSVRQPDANELGWKETVRMNPLEDILVALQPITPPTPWPLPNSVRLNDVSGSTMNFSNLNPFNNGGAVTQDGSTNFGWEYVWHCHILGHEENDMMRPILWQVPPPAPVSLTAVPDTVNGGVKLSWTDKSASETGFIIQRDTNPAFPNPVPINAPASVTRNAAGEGIDWGATQTTTDNASLTAGINYYYRAQAIDDGFKAPFEQSYNVTSALSLGWSNTAQILPAPIADITPTVLAFGNVTVGSTTQTLANGQLAQVTISNAGNADLTLAAVQSGSADFGSNASGCVTVTPGATCVFTVTYSPNTIGPASGTITLTTNDTANPTLVVSMSGTGVVTTAIAINAPTVTYNANGLVTLTVSAVPSGTPTGNVTLSVDGGAAISQALTAGVSTFTITAPNAGNHTLLANYAAQNGFLASTATGTLTVNPAALTISPTPNPATMTFGGTVPALTPSYTGFITGQGPANLTGTATCSTNATATSPVGAYTSVCAGATSTNYAISYPQGAVNVVKATSAVAITSNRPTPAILGQIVTVSFNVAPQFSGTPTGNVTVTASTGESCSGALTGGAGSCTLTFATGGSRTLTAAYAGDGNFFGSGPSAAVTQTVSNLSLSTTSLLFGNQNVGTRSAAQTVTLSNVGTTTLTISSITWTANFSDSTNCGTTLLAGRSCRINVVFAPTTTGVLTGTLTITDSDITSPQIVTLTGTGVQPGVSLTPTSWAFGPVTRGSTSAPQTFTLANTGTATLTINNINLNGANPGQFAIQSRTCGTTLASGASCTINVVFAPNRRGNFTANLRVADNAPNSPQTATLTGTGQ